MNQIYICLLLLLFQSVSSVSAQVATTVSGYPVIDLNALEPLGCVLSFSDAVARRTAMYAPGVTPSNSELLPVGIDISGPNGTWNAKMSAKYQVMQVNHAVGNTDFTTAWNTCKEYAGEGGSKGTWRLPTQRELYMIWVLQPQLIKEASFTTPLVGDYRGSTEVDAPTAWLISFYSGNAYPSSKTSFTQVRCIRDLM